MIRQNILIIRKNFETLKGHFTQYLYVTISKRNYDQGHIDEYQCCEE